MHIEQQVYMEKIQVLEEAVEAVTMVEDLAHKKRIGMLEEAEAVAAAI